MLELREYKYAEIAEYLHCSSPAGLNKKLNNYEVKYQQKGRGQSSTYIITAINNPFKLFSVFELAVSPQVDFRKLSYFFYELLNDQYMGLGAEMIEEKLRKTSHPISRQTISKYLKYAENNYLIAIDNTDCVYYRVYKHYGEQVHEEITKAEYSKAWKYYWHLRNEEGWDSSRAFTAMYNMFNGAPRKQGKILRNGIFNELINWLLEIIERDLSIDDITDNEMEKV